MRGEKMTACREQILAAVAAALGTITAVAGLAVERDRAEDQPITTAELPRLVVYDDGEAEEPLFTGERDVTLSVAIEGYCAGATPLAAQQAAAVLRAEVDRVLLADPPLAGLARDVRLAGEGEPARLELPGADPVECFARVIEIDYATAELDPEIFAD